MGGTDVFHGALCCNLPVLKVLVSKCCWTRRDPECTHKHYRGRQQRGVGCEELGSLLELRLSAKHLTVWAHGRTLSPQQRCVALCARANECISNPLEPVNFPFASAGCVLAACQNVGRYGHGDTVTQGISCLLSKNRVLSRDTNVAARPINLLLGVSSMFNRKRRPSFLNVEVHTYFRRTS